MGYSFGGPIVRDGLLFLVDAADKNSYPGSGTAWTDLSGNGNNGTINSATFSDEGYFSFDGSDDYVDFGAFTNLNSSNTFSVNIWYRTNTDDSLMSMAAFSTSGDASSEVSFNVRGDKTGDEIGTFGRNDGTKMIVIEQGGSGSVIDNEWYFYAATFSASGNKLYHNGFQTTPTYASGGGDATTEMTIPADTNKFTIGANIDSGGYQYFYNGEIVRVAVYSKELTPEEVLQNYNEQRTRFPI